MNYRFWVFLARLNLLAVVVNTYVAIVTGSWVNIFFVVFNSFVLAWCIAETLDSLITIPNPRYLPKLPYDKGDVL